MLDKNTIDKLEVVAALHVALDPRISPERLDAIRADMAERYPEFVASGFHGLRRFNPEYPTQV